MTIPKPRITDTIVIIRIWFSVGVRLKYAFLVYFMTSQSGGCHYHLRNYQTDVYTCSLRTSSAPVDMAKKYSTKAANQAIKTRT